MEGFQAIWIIYGNIIFSDTNRCFDQMPILSYFMLALLIIGYF